MQNNCSKTDVTYAGFWVRLAAYTIDSIIVFFGLLLVRFMLSGILALAEGTALGGNILFHYTLKDIVLYVFQVIYFILFTYLAGTTPGKWLMNLRVVGADRHEKLSLTDVLYRETIGRFLCSLTIGIGYILAGVDKEKRGLHDILCDTRVVYEKKVKVYRVYQGPPAGNAPAGNVPMGNVPVGNTPMGNAPTGNPQGRPPQMPPVQVTPPQMWQQPPKRPVPPRTPSAGNMPAEQTPPRDMDNSPQSPHPEDTEERNPQL